MYLTFYKMILSVHQKNSYKEFSATLYNTHICTCINNERTNERQINRQS